MQVVWKFPLPFNRGSLLDGQGFEIEMPAGARLLHVAMQGSRFSDGKPCIWALVNDENRKVTRRFALRATGQSCDGIPLGASHAYVGTFFEFEDGSKVWHLFDCGEVR